MLFQQIQPSSPAFPALQTKPRPCQHVSFINRCLIFCGLSMFSANRAWFIIKSRFQLKINSLLMKENSQLQIRIHEILQRKGFYTLPLHSLNSILRLLQMEEARDAKVIEANTIFGLIRWTELHQQKLQNYFADKKYSDVGLETKLYLSSIIRTIIDPHQPQTMIDNTMRNHLGYPFNPYNYLNFPRFPPPPIPNNIPYQSQYIPFPNPQINYYPMFGAYPPDTSPVLRNSSSIRTELQRIAAQSKRKAQMDQQMPLAPQVAVKQDYEDEKDEKPQTEKEVKEVKVAKVAQKAKEYVIFKPNNRSKQTIPIKRSKRIEALKQKSVDDYLSKRYLQLEISQSQKPQKPQRPQRSQRALRSEISQPAQRNLRILRSQVSPRPQKPKKTQQISRKKLPQRQIQEKPVIYHQLPIPEEQQEKYPELQLKNYNSISDFDYKWFPPVLAKNKKASKSVETQTDLNFIVNDFTIVDKKWETPLESKEDIPHIDEASESEPPHEQQLDIKPEQQHMFPEPVGQASCLFQAILQENHVEPEHAEEIEYVTPQIKAVNDLYKCACEGNEEGDWLECTSCFEKYHYQCLKVLQGAADSFECPRCRIRSIDPLVAVKDVCGEYFLSNLGGQPFKANLNLIDYDFLDITRNKNVDKMKDIELRCIRINYKDTSQNEICWPDEAIIKVNGLKTTEFYGSPGKRRKDGPIIITQSIFKYEDYDYEDIRNVMISLQLKHKNNTPEHYLLGVYFTEKYRAEDLFQLIKTNLQPCSPDFMQKLMNFGDQEEISLEKEVFRLNDPFSGQLIDLPVRGINCRHSQCFDLKTYLTLMYGLKHRAWRCPVCWRQAKKFMMDTGVLQLVQRMRQVNAVAAEANLMKDGSLVVKVIKVDKEKESSSENEEEEERKKTKKIKKKERTTTVKKQDADYQPIRAFFNPPKTYQNGHESLKAKRKGPTDLDLHDYP